MKSEWTKPPTTAPFNWSVWRRSFIEMLAEFGEYALVAIIILAFIAWLALMPSIGFLWLVGWL